MDGVVEKCLGFGAANTRGFDDEKEGSGVVGLLDDVCRRREIWIAGERSEEARVKDIY